MKKRAAKDAHPLAERTRLRPAGPALDRRREPRQRLTVQLPESVIDRLRAAVFYTAGATLTALVAEAVLNHITALEEDRGKPFPKRRGPLRAGRPAKEK